MNSSVGGLLNVLAGLRHLIETAGEQRRSRIALVVLAGLVLAALSLVIGLVWGLWDAARGVNAQEWLLPIFLAVFFVVMAGFAPFIPLWMLNVPDNEVWMLFDSTDHLEKFVGSGVYAIRPVQGYAPYPQKGAIPITIELEQVLTSDHFPYRVIVSVTANFNPMAADKSMYKALIKMTKEIIGNAIRADITDLVKREMAHFGRQEIDPPTMMQVLSQAVRDAIDARQMWGVTLGAINPIKVYLEPPREVLTARNELWAEESKAETRLKHMAELLKLAGATNMSVGDLGRLHFFLTPPAGMRVNLTGNHEMFPARVPEYPTKNAQQALPAPKNRKAAAELPPIQMPKIEAPAEPLAEALIAAPPDVPQLQPFVMPPDVQNAPPPRQARAPVDRNPPPEPPPNLPENIPPRRPDAQPTRSPERTPEPPRRDNEVIETEQDENGTFVPVNPILRRKKSRPSK